MRQGLTVGIAGIVAGLILSLMVLFIQMRYSLIQLPVGNMPNLVLPVDMRLSDFLFIPVISFVLTWLSIYIPASKAGKIDAVLLIREGH